jgi:hypothetical protein
MTFYADHINVKYIGNGDCKPAKRSFTISKLLQRTAIYYQELTPLQIYQERTHKRANL